MDIQSLGLKTGDIFCTEGVGIFELGVSLAQAINSSDSKSQYHHSGIILSPAGTTFEALSTIKQATLKEKAGKRVLIARPTAQEKSGFPITTEQIGAALIFIMNRYQGLWYPFWRIPLHIIPPLAKFVSYKGKFLVCSELVAAYLFFIKARHGQFTGTTPDTLADEWIHWKNFDIIYEGVL